MSIMCCMKRPLTMLCAALASGLAFAAVTAAARKGIFDASDTYANERLAKLRRSRTRAARYALKTAHVVQPIGKLYGTAPLAGLIAASLLAKRRSRRRITAAATVASASLLAAVGEKLFDRLIFFRAPPPSHPRPTKPSYPSGHALNSSAAAGTAAYILAREHAAPPSLAVALAVTVPALAVGSKLLLGRHWLSDVSGGLLAGATLTCACAATYEVTR
jgi:membrane-associated phospholipid phosphatase